MSPSVMSALSVTYRTRQKVLGYPVDLVNLDSALEVIETAWRADKRVHVETLNAEMVMAARKDHRLDRIIRHAHLIIPDGAGVVWALRLAGQKVDRLPGIDLASAALKLAARQGVKVALLGGRKEVVSTLEQSLPNIYPGLELSYCRDGYFSEADEAQIVDDMAQSEPKLVLLALGVPKQEFFIDQHREKLSRAVLIGVGGSFDVWAGVVRRAPLIFQRLNLEWFYRLITQPWRLKRMATTLPSFALQVLAEKWRLSSAKGKEPDQEELE
jgi:N-acetylglucosaminyldiphosphoundecaprenol N-acetyl-beta-D-mannosaminyltransferase